MLDVLLAALVEVDADRQILYRAVVYATSPAAARRRPEVLMATQTGDEPGELVALVEGVTRAATAGSTELVA